MHLLCATAMHFLFEPNHSVDNNSYISNLWFVGLPNNMYITKYCGW